MCNIHIYIYIYIHTHKLIEGAPNRGPLKIPMRFEDVLLEFDVNLSRKTAASSKRRGGGS